MEWNNPSQFDLVVNLDQIKVTGAVDLIARAVSLPEFNSDGGTNQAFEDERITAKIWVRTKSKGVARFMSMMTRMATTVATRPTR